MSEWSSPAAIAAAWTIAERFDPARLGADVTYLRAETLDGRALAFAPLGSPKPWQSGEGEWWQMRTETT